MDKEAEAKKLLKKSSKGKIFRNIWLICLLMFFLSFVALVVSAMNNNLSLVGLTLIALILSVMVGGVSFLIWIFRLINKRLEEKPNRYISVFLRVFGILTKLFLIFVGLLIFLYLFVLRPTRIYGTSMEPKFNDQEYLLTEKVSYYARDPRRGEVVVYTTFDEDHIGRVVGLPNETLIIQKGQIEVASNLLDEPYTDWSRWEGKEPSTFKLGGDEYLVLSDKRTSVQTVLSVVKKAQFQGKVFYRYWPLARAGFITL